MRLSEWKVVNYVLDYIKAALTPQVYSPIGEYLSEQTLRKINESRSWADEGYQRWWEDWNP